MAEWDLDIIQQSLNANTFKDDFNILCQHSAGYLDWPAIGNQMLQYLIYFFRFIFKVGINETIPSFDLAKESIWWKKEKYPAYH